LRAVETLKPDYTASKLEKKINVLKTNYNHKYKVIDGNALVKIEGSIES